MGMHGLSISIVCLTIADTQMSSWTVVQQKIAEYLGLKADKKRDLLEDPDPLLKDPPLAPVRKR